MSGLFGRIKRREKERERERGREKKRERERGREMWRGMRILEEKFSLFHISFFRLGSTFFSLLKIIKIHNT